MNLFETLRTALKVLILNFSQNTILYFGVILLSIVLLWSILSCIFNNCLKYRKYGRQMIYYLINHNVDKSNYTEFILKLGVFPKSVRFGWKKYENKIKGLPSDYLSIKDNLLKNNCDKQTKSNCSAMLVYNVISIIVLTLLSLYVGGLFSVQKTVDAYITTKIFADAMILPICYLVLSSIIYFIYKMIRRNQYSLFIDSYYDMLNMLDNNVNLVKVFEGDYGTINLISKIYTNDTYLELKKKSQKIERKDIEEVRVGVKNIKPVGENTNSSTLVSEKSQTEMQKREPIVVPTEKTETINRFVVNNETEFVEGIDKVNGMLAELKQEADKSKKIELEKQINVMMKGLTEFKQKAKTNKNGD